MEWRVIASGTPLTHQFAGTFINITNRRTSHFVSMIRYLAFSYKSAEL
jgi:hypothetical protein